MKQPCKRDCENRSPGCGANCDKWKAWVEYRDTNYQHRINERYANEAVVDGILRVGKARTRRKNYGIIPS